MIFSVNKTPKEKHDMFKKIKEFFTGKSAEKGLGFTDRTTKVEAPYKIETPAPVVDPIPTPAPIVEQTSQVMVESIAPEKKPRTPRKPKTEPAVKKTRTPRKPRSKN